MGYQDAHLLSSKILPGMPAEVVHYEKRDFRLPRATFKGYKCFAYGIQGKPRPQNQGLTLQDRVLLQLALRKKLLSSDNKCVISW
jgi:hypothetical protein